MSIVISPQSGVLQQLEELRPTYSPATVDAEAPADARPLDDQKRLGIVDQISRFTLLMIVIFTAGHWAITATMQGLGIVGLVWPSVSRRSSFWFIVTAVHLAAVNLYQWDLADNHKWLYTWWFLALACSRMADDPQDALARNARLLIGFTFLFAFLRKILSPEYMSGDTFRFLLVTDSRFFEVSRFFGGYFQAPQAIEEGMNQLHDTVVFSTPDTLNQFAKVLSLWTAAIEGFVAALFLWSHRGVTMWRHVALLMFILAVYPIAPVLGFAWILLILGCAALPLKARRMRMCYMTLLTISLLCHGHSLKSAVCRWWFGHGFYLPM